MTHHPLKAGVIGTGFIGPVHIEALRRLGVPVTALCDLPDRITMLIVPVTLPATTLLVETPPARRYPPSGLTRP